MLDFLPYLLDFVFSQIEAIWLLYTGSSILCGFFVLWILDRLFHIFDIIKR